MRISLQGWECRPPGPLQRGEVAEGLWWLVACCESPHAERTLEGPLDLYGGSTTSQRGLAHGSPGLPALPVQVTMRLAEHGPGVLLVGNGDEGLWVTGLQGQN